MFVRHFGLLNWSTNTFDTLNSLVSSIPITNYDHERTLHQKYLAIIGRELVTHFNSNGDELIFGHSWDENGAQYQRILFDIWHTMYAAWCSLGFCFDILPIQSPVGQMSQEMMFRNQHTTSWQEWMGVSAPTGITGNVHIPNKDIIPSQVTPQVLFNHLNTGLSLYGLLDGNDNDQTPNIVLPFGDGDSVNKTTTIPPTFRDSVSTGQGTFKTDPVYLPYALFAYMADTYPTESHTYTGFHRAPNGTLKKTVVINSAFDSKSDMPINNPLNLPLHGTYQ